MYHPRKLKKGSRPKPIRPRPLSLEYSLWHEGNEQTVRATSEASARIKAARKLSEKLGVEVTPFELKGWDDTKAR